MLIYTIQYKNYKITKYINQNKLHLRCHWVAVEVDVQLTDILLFADGPLAAETSQGDQGGAKQVKSKTSANEAHIFSVVRRVSFERHLLS